MEGAARSNQRTKQPPRSARVSTQRERGARPGRRRKPKRAHPCFDQSFLLRLDPKPPCGCRYRVKGAEGIPTKEGRDEGAPLTRYRQPLRQWQIGAKQEAKAR